MKEIITLSRATPFKAYELAAKFKAYCADILVPTGEAFLGEKVIVSLWEDEIRTFTIPGNVKVSEVEFDFNKLKFGVFKSIFIGLNGHWRREEKEIIDAAKILVKHNLL